MLATSYGSISGRRPGVRRRSPRQSLKTTLSLDDASLLVRRRVLEQLAQQQSQPSLGIASNAYRSNSNEDQKQVFRATLLKNLQARWQHPQTSAAFLKLVEQLETEGCTVFAGLVGEEAFSHLIDSFTGLMNGSGSKSFLHSFVNLADHPDFIANPTFNAAYMHPLMIAMISYVMGGAIRLTDARGKDTNPISVRAQDNMLHVDNTPFREEYKILVAWEKGACRGPTGQNFTYLPGTNLGTRNIRVDASGTPWSTENDSIFVTSASVQRVLDFQTAINGGSGPFVAEVCYPDRPVSIVFNASALVHHRHRTQDTNARSCIIAAFHLVSDNPGALKPGLEIAALNNVAGNLIDPPEPATSDGFVGALLREAADIESKILEISEDQGDMTLICKEQLKLTGDLLARWEADCASSPSTTCIRLHKDVFLSSGDRPLSASEFCKRVASVMSFDKHGLLDLILYRDGHEEIRKQARKRIWSMDMPHILSRLKKWLKQIGRRSFVVEDILEPSNLRQQTDRIVSLVWEQLSEKHAAHMVTSKTAEERLSFCQLLKDLGESVVRCDEVETYVSTTLFMFWTLDNLLPSVNCGLRREASVVAIKILRSYLASVLLVESFQLGQPEEQ